MNHNKNTFLSRYIEISQWGKESILMGQKAQAWVAICYLADLPHGYLSRRPALIFGIFKG